MIRSRVPGVVRPLCFFRACVEVSRPGHRAADEPGEPGPSCVQRGAEATTALASARCARSTPSSSRVTTGAPRPGLAAYAQRSGRSMASPDRNRRQGVEVTSPGRPVAKPAVQPGSLGSSRGGKPRPKAAGYAGQGWRLRAHRLRRPARPRQAARCKGGGASGQAPLWTFSLRAGEEDAGAELTTSPNRAIWCVRRRILRSMTRTASSCQPGLALQAFKISTVTVTLGYSVISIITAIKSRYYDIVYICPYPFHCGPVVVVGRGD